jgi:hypothetical protein
MPQYNAAKGMQQILRKLANLDDIRSDFRASVTLCVAENLKDFIRERVQVRGLGAGESAVDGYSIKPINITGYNDLQKGMVGTPGFYAGGYRSYRQQNGLSSHFSFTNTGEAWKFWGYTLSNRNSVAKLGWGTPKDRIAAQRASELRPDLFLIDQSDLVTITNKIAFELESKARLAFTALVNQKR